MAGLMQNKENKFKELKKEQEALNWFLSYPLNEQGQLIKILYEIWSEKIGRFADLIDTPKKV